MSVTPQLSRRAWVSVAVIVATLLGLTALFLFTPLRELFTSPETLRESVKKLGILGPAMMVGLYILQTLVATIPGQVLDLANGYLFSWWGIPVSLIGMALGSSLAILLARQFGRPLVAALITPKGMQHIRPYTRRRSEWLFFILFLLPGTPADLFCYAIGLTAIPLRRSITLTVLGRAPAVTAAVLFGATGRNLGLLEFSLISIAFTAGVALILWFWPPAKKMIKSALPTP